MKLLLGGKRQPLLRAARSSEAPPSCICEVAHQMRINTNRPFVKHIT